jgi:hypothetical protein
MNGRVPLGPAVVVVLLGALLAWGMAALFRMRFARGDVYPEYSSLRADPLGTKVLHDALSVAGIAVSRNHRDLARWRSGAATVYVCGLRWEVFATTGEREWKGLLESVERGGRLVVAFRPHAPVPKPEDAPRNPFLERLRDGAPEKGAEKHAGRAGAETNDGAKARPEGKEEIVQTAEGAGTPLGRLLGIGRDTLPRTTREGWTAVLGEGVSDDLPPQLAWRSALAFAPESAAGWRVLYAAGERPVAVARCFGAGTIVLLGDGSHLGNEAMQSGRQPEMLAWLQGAERGAVFDESHLGVRENAGVAALARRYGLGHAAIVAVAVALLFVWRSASSLVPAEASATAGGRELAGREAAAGFVGLLRRTLPVHGFFAACASEFRRSTAWRRADERRRAAFDRIAADAAAARDPLAAMRRAHDVFDRKA